MVRVWVRGSRERGGGALNRSGRSPLDVRAPDSGTGRRPARTRTRVRLGYGAGKKMTGGPHLSATASEETARRGPARRWRATKRTRPGVRGLPADFGRRAALAGLGFKQKKSGAFSRLLNFERFKLKIKHLNSNANLNSSNQKQCISMNATINSYD